jgi:hypothetical protein
MSAAVVGYPPEGRDHLVVASLVAELLLVTELRVDNL